MGVKDYLGQLVGGAADIGLVRRALEADLNDVDPCSRAAKARLVEMGLAPPAALKALAYHRSYDKYGYVPAPETLDRIVQLADREGKTGHLTACLERPFFLVKAAWLAEHAPFFIFRGSSRAEEVDALILDLARQYRLLFLEHSVGSVLWRRQTNPSRLRRTTFWESKVLDPLDLIRQTMEDNLEGLELSVDFHPFNFARLLPEEIADDKREQIRAACERTGVKIDIHSPIIGPYVPSPDPGKGKQSFFDPAKALGIQLETIQLARAIGAEAVVVHLIDMANSGPLLQLVEAAAGSAVRVTLENYCHLPATQDAQTYVAFLEDFVSRLPPELRARNFGITLDLGHLNIEGDDPLVGAETVGRWCRDRAIYLRVHATDNYGRLLYGPPHYSADVHANVAGRGINSGLIIRMLRSMGLQFSVVAEQIKPLTREDVDVIDDAQTGGLDKPFEAYVELGRARLADVEFDAFLAGEFLEKDAYRFVAGLHDVAALREYAVYRRIQDKKFLSVDEAKKLSQDFMKMPARLKRDLTTYIDDLLLPVQTETGTIRKTQLDLICQNLNGALFWTISSEHMNDVFETDRLYRKDEVVCEQGQTGTEMYFIKEGSVGVFLDRVQVATLGLGELFGEISLFYNVPRSATVKAAEEGTRIGVLTRTDLAKLLESRQPFVHELVFRLYSILPQRLRNMNEKYRAAIQKLRLVSGNDSSELVLLTQTEARGDWLGADFLATLSVDDALTISEEVLAFETGERIFDEGDEANGVYFVLEGQVAVSVAGNDGKRVALAEIQAGEIFGEMALIDKKPRSARVETLTPAKLAFTGSETFEAFIDSRSDLAFRLMGFICLSIFKRIRRLDQVYSQLKEGNGGRAAT